MVTTGSPDHGPAGAVGCDAAMAAVVLLLGGVLAAAGTSLLQRWAHAPAARPAMGFEDQLGCAATLTGLIVLGWWSVSALTAVTAAVLERSGRPRAAAAAGSLSPAFMRRLALAAFGLQLLTAPIASATTPQPAPAPPRSVELSAAGYRAAPVPLLPAGGRDQPAIDGPAGIDPRWKPPAPAVDPGSLAARQLRSGEQAGDGPAVTVRTGDSLWSLTAAALGPLATEIDIARAWPRLYQANREVIGENPHLLHPGQVLRLPPQP